MQNGGPSTRPQLITCIKFKACKENKYFTGKRVADLKREWEIEVDYDG